MTRIRPRRVAEQVRELLADLLTRKLNDPRLKDVRITDVRMSPDLRQATVFFSIFPADEQRHIEAEAGFASASGLMRRELGLHLRLRATPDLHFRPDRTADHADHIERLLAEEARELGLDRGPSAPGDPDPGDS